MKKAVRDKIEESGYFLWQLEKEKVRGRIMKKKLCAVLCAATVFLTGCGAVELTDKESDLIAEYAATVLLKHSTTYQPKLQDQVVEVETTSISPVQPSSSKDLSETQGGQTGQNKSDVPVSTEAPSKSLTEALGIAQDGFGVEYAGYEIVQKYIDSKPPQLSIQVKDTNQRYLVLKFQITNHSEEEKECDILSKKRTYRCRVNDTERFGSQMTMLFDDLSTFKETFSANETKQAVLVFQIPAEYEGNITGLSLTVKEDEESNTYSYGAE